MDALSSIQSVQALSALLSPPAEETDDEDYENMKPMARMGPSHIGATPSTRGKAQETVSSAYIKEHNKDIWDVEEVNEGTHFDDLTDCRPQPEYEIVLKQRVGTEDLFLGLSRKDPSSMCCESMLVKVKLSDTKAADIVLDVKETFLDLRTPKYEEGTARFISERAELEVTLPMNRALDCINLA
ncbi:protein PIH1D3 isoform X2 [Electrophorus electricus]|uniref:protein PIH1D3 isoform X2 n=1 Tax=Electrophorus electricus TaxID=8005 RepID=UPI0015D01633|nr:protein PIH1D3 isoform X2 [Electrophorus electricus]